MITKTIKITVAAILTAALIVSGSILIPYTGDVAIAADEYSADQIDGEVIVFMKDRAKTDAEDLEKKVGSVDDVTLVSDMEGQGEIALARSDDSSTKEMINDLEKREDVLFAEPNYLLHLASADLTGQQYSADMKNGLGIEGWNRKNAKGEPLPKVSTKGKVVAVMDSGIDYGHEDLKNVMWADGLKYKALKGMGGGKYGINLAYKDASGKKYDTKDPMDDYHHGTHIAGIIAGEWNSYGISGMTSGARIMAVKIAHEKGSFSVLNVIKGYEYIIAAKKAGVDICAVNCSLSFPVFSKAVDTLARQAGKLGVISCFAAGNEGMDSDYSSQDNNQYGSDPYIVTVGASGKGGKPASFSNYGRRTVDVFAPGESIMSTIPTSMGRLDINGPAAKDKSGRDMYTGFEDVSIKDNKESSIFGFEGKDTELSLAGNAHSGSKCLKLKGLKSSGDKCCMKISSGQMKGALGISLWVKIPRYFLGYTELALYDGDKQIEDVTVNEDGDKSGWYNVNALLKKKYDSFTIRMSFDSQDEQEKAISEMYIDDVKLTDEVVAYKKISGTSMATPAVTGGAAILSAYYKNDSAAKIAARIQGSVKRVSEMKKKSISGGIFRVDRALSGNTDPVLRSVKTSGKKLAIKGYFFGSQKGRVTVGGRKCKVISWKDGKVIVRLPKKVRTGEKIVKITTKKNKTGHQFFRLKTPSKLFKRLPLPGRKVKGDPGTYKVRTQKFEKTFYSYSPRALVGQRGKLYYLMSDKKIQKDGHTKCVIYEYNIKKKKWKRKFKGGYTPEGAACTWNGKILFKAIDELNNKTYLSVYDPKKNKLKSKLVNSYSCEMETELVNNGKVIMEFGGYLEQYVSYSDNKSYFGNARLIDPKKMTRKKIGGASLLADGIKAIYDKRKNVYALTAARSETDSFKGIYKLNVVKAKKKTILKGKKIVKKDLFKKMLKNTGGQTDTYVVGGPVKGGAIYSGPIIVKNKNKAVKADTYRFSFKKKKKGLVPMKKRVSMARLSVPCATTYRGHYYVIAQTNTENGKWVFATCKVKTFKQPGDR